jgi:hypothetical protein
MRDEEARREYRLGMEWCRRMLESTSWAERVGIEQLRDETARLLRIGNE